MKRLAVIGAGPVGIEAALCGLEKGFDVAVYERGEVGATLLRWGQTRFFSPFGMNVSARVKAALGASAPADDALLTGPRFAQDVLQALTSRPPLEGRVHSRTSVIAVGKDRMTRRDRPGHPLRAERPFVLLLEGPEGEREVKADVVLDCSGVSRPARLGPGGRPALGERAVEHRFVRYLGDLQAKAAEIEGRRVLLVGNGHSAANAAVWLAGLAERAPETRVTWAVRTLNRRPVQAVANDPLPERASIVDRANDLAASPPAFLTVERRAHVQAVVDTGEGLQVSLSGDRKQTFDLVCAFTGYRPDHDLSAELTVDSSAVSEGTARLYAALSNVTDCLCVPRASPADLATGEPGFYWVGSKAYGRMNTFLLKDGIGQVEAILGQEAE